MAKKDDDLRELRAMVAETLLAADDALDILKDDEGMGNHRRILQWLLPDAQKTLDSLRDGKELSISSDEMLPVHTIAIVIDHIDYLVEDAVAQMTDEEYEKLMSSGQ